ncbi:DUF5667 domain-containing protein [Cytobacillus sp. IB215665]|uniref:DUF5667 domain-containing protein n=1 Tax=Cytobacillus sp. IB215665 TaxID=3097357 RepID=UPI002A161FAC|nr:DUF5667 domain-containing protein [Cytobacillus sp. IB215665]MDX8365786.1 DUF5667 domain-containing protein [Cytobacillus sp. IB215665]
MIKVIRNGIIACALVVVIAVAGTIANANENNTDIESTTSLNTNSEDLKSIPGDFLYFIKITLEKIQLAISFDDMYDAELLARFSSQRLLEAEKLIANGDKDLAEELILKATKLIDDSEGIIEDRQDEEAKSRSDEDSNNDIYGDTSQPNIDNNGNISIEQQDEMTDIKTQLAQNIISLTAALEKVGNNNAQEALKKNIEKSYKRIGDKMTKLGALQEEQKNIEDDIELIINELYEDIENDAQDQKHDKNKKQNHKDQKELEKEQKKKAHEMKKEQKKKEKELRNEEKNKK